MSIIGPDRKTIDSNHTMTKMIEKKHYYWYDHLAYFPAVFFYFSFVMERNKWKSK